MAEFNFTGWIGEIDNSRNYRPFKFSVKDQTNQVQWFNTFDFKVGQIIEQGGINSGPWNVNYIIKPWVGKDGVERYNYDVRSISGGTAPASQAPVPQAPVPQVPMPQTPLPPVQQDSSQQLPNWVATLDDRGRSIIRQVAFKEVPDKDNKPLEEIARLTDAYEVILLCSFEPDPPPSDDELIQQSF